MPKTLVFLDNEKERFPSQNKVLIRLYDMVMKTYFKITRGLIQFYWRKSWKKIKYEEIKEDEKFIKKIETWSKELMNEIEKNELFKKTFFYNDISLWEINSLDILTIFFAPRVIRLKKLEKVIKKEKPKRIIVFQNDLNYLILKYLCKKHRIKFSDRTLILSKLLFFLKRKMLQLVAKSFWPAGMKALLKIKNDKIRLIPKNNKKNIFLISNSSRAHLMIDWSRHWIEKLNGDYNIIFAELDPKVKTIYDKKNCNTIFFKDYLTKKHINLIKKHHKNMKKEWHLIKKTREFKRMDVYGIPIHILFEDMFNYLMGAGFLRALIYIFTTKNIYINEKPDLIISYGGLNVIGKALTINTKKYGIKNLIIQHGFLDDGSYISPLIAQKIAVLGKQTKEIFVRRGMEEKQIIITGQPRFDEIINKKFSKEEFYKKFNIPKDKKLLVYTSQSFPEKLNKKIITIIYNACKNLKDYFLFVKLHQDDKIEFYKKIIEKSKIENIRISKNVELYHTISSADIGITVSSTTGLETLLFDKPLIVLKMPSDRSDYIGPYTDKPCAITVHNSKEIENAIKSLEDKKVQNKLKKARKKFIEYYAYKQDGKASERVAKLIEDLTK